MSVEVGGLKIIILPSCLQVIDFFSSKDTPRDYLKCFICRGAVPLSVSLAVSMKQ